MVFRLPALTAGDSVWRLPVSNAAVPTLLGVLFAGNRQHQTIQLSKLLAAEPAFALWVAVRAFPKRAPESVTELAEWFVQQPATTVLDCGGTEAGGDDTAAQLLTWSRLAEGSVLAARSAAAICAERAASGDCNGATASSEQAYFFALLSAALDWLCSSGSRISCDDCHNGLSCLPEWLLDFISDLKHPKAKPLVRVVAEACKRSPDIAGESKRRLDDVGSRWEHGDELSELTNVLPHVVTKLARLEQLETQFARQLETEKLASLYWLAYGASHEVNNPLANISTRAQTLLRDETDPERKRMLATINSQAFRAHEMINDLMLFANPPELVRGEVNANELLQEAIGEILPVADDQGTTISGHWNDDPHLIHVDREQLVVALQALLKNSLQAIGSGGRIDVSADWCDTSESPQATFQIVVADTGPGIPPDIRRHMFDPFFSGREAGRGLGMGLSKCWRIVQLHGGRIDVADGRRGGATFRIEL